MRIAGVCPVEAVVRLRYSGVLPVCVGAEIRQRSVIYDRGSKRPFGQVRHSSAAVLRLSHRDGWSEVWRWFLLLDRQGSDRVTRNTDAGVLRGTPADGMLASPATSGLAPASSSNWQQVFPTQQMSVWSKRHRRMRKSNSQLYHLDPSLSRGPRALLRP